MFKTIAIAVAFVTASVVAASANNSFGLMRGLQQGSEYYDVRLVRTDAPGVVQIETRNGNVIGTAPVNRGTNTNVRVRFTAGYSAQDLVAKLLINGIVVDERRVEVHRRLERTDD